EGGRAPFESVEAVIVNAAGCGAAMKEYGWLLKDDPEWSTRASAFAAKVKDATEYLADIGVREQPRGLGVRATWDDPCHLLHGQAGLRAAGSRVTVVHLMDLLDQAYGP